LKQTQFSNERIRIMLSLRNVSLVVVALALAIGFSGSRATADEHGKGTISGKVTNADGSAAGGAQIRLMKPMARDRKADPAAQQAKPAPGDRPKPVAQTTADADGKYTLSDVPAGKYVVQAGIKGTARGRQPVEVKAGQTVTADIKLEAAKAK
jgi:hypothetical protein